MKKRELTIVITMIMSVTILNNGVITFAMTLVKTDKKSVLNEGDYDESHSEYDLGLSEPIEENLRVKENTKYV